MELEDYMYDDNFEDGTNELDLEEIVGLDEMVDSGLSNSDYNLDSPLNPDFVDGLVHHLKTGAKPTHHLSRILKESKIIRDRGGLIHIPTLKDSKFFHFYLGRTMMRVASGSGSMPERFYK